MKARPQRGTAKAGRHVFSARSSFLTIRDPLSAELQPGDYKVLVHAGDQELTEKVTVSIKTDTVLKVARQGNQFVLERVQGQAGEPAKTAATGQTRP